MARTKKSERDIRTLAKLAGGRSHAITIPIDLVREWGWEAGQLFELTIDSKKQRIIIEEKAKK